MGKYEEIVKKIPAPEQPIGPLAGIATRLDYLGPQVEELISKGTVIEKKLEKLEYAVRTLELPGGVAMTGVNIEQVPFAYDLAALQGVTLDEYAPFSGYIKQVSIHWPDGCDALVDVRLGHGTKQFCPDDGYLALNDATPTYPFNEWVDDHEEIWVEMRNTDGGNPHSITVTITLEGVTP